MHPEDMPEGTRPPKAEGFGVHYCRRESAGKARQFPSAQHSMDSRPTASVVRNVAGSSVRRTANPEGTGRLHENWNAKRNNAARARSCRWISGTEAGNAQKRRLEVILGSKKTWMSREAIEEDISCTFEEVTEADMKRSGNQRGARSGPSLLFGKYSTLKQTSTGGCNAAGRCRYEVLSNMEGIQSTWTQTSRHDY